MTKQILVGGVPIGGGAPVVIQSMLNTKTTDVEGSLKQIRQLASAGCQIAPTGRFPTWKPPGALRTSARTLPCPS